MPSNMNPPFRFDQGSGTAMSPKEMIQKEILESKYMEYLEKDALKNEKNAMLAWLKTVEIVEADKISDTTARIVYRFPVQHTYLNPQMTLQGGIQAALFDTATTWLLGLIRKPPDFWMRFGTSRSLNVTYVRPAPEGEDLLMETEIIHAGKKLCLLKGILMREKDRAIISTCEHQKYNIDADAPKM